MSLTTIQSFNWNPNKKCFEIPDSDDRNIVSFFFKSIMPTCFFYSEKSLSDYPWSQKGMTYFKKTFLEKIDRTSKNHIDRCPVEEYKKNLTAYYEELRREVSDFSIDDSAPKEIALLALQKTCAQCFKKLFSKAPLNIPEGHLQDTVVNDEKHLNALDKGQCYHYAFYLTKEYDVMQSMIPFDSDCNAAFLLYPKYFIQQLGYTQTDTPVSGDLVLYLGDPKLHNNCRFKHLGVMTERGTVKSCWGSFTCQLEHQINQVPAAYGSEVIFFHKNQHNPPNFTKITKTTSQISQLVLQFNSEYIPSPLSPEGALIFMFDKMKAACKRTNQASAEWPWSKIEESLRTTIVNPTANRDELRKEFQLWMQETLQQCFMYLP